MTKVVKFIPGMQRLLVLDDIQMGVDPLGSCNLQLNMKIYMHVDRKKGSIQQNDIHITDMSKV